MMCGPLKGKKQQIIAYACYDDNPDATKNKLVGKPLTIFESHKVKSALEWMIQQHEERIEVMIKLIEFNFSEPIEYYTEEYEFYDDKNTFMRFLDYIKQEYEAIMILEEGLEDVL